MFFKLATYCLCDFFFFIFLQFTTTLDEERPCFVSRTWELHQTELSTFFFFSNIWKRMEGQGLGGKLYFKTKLDNMTLIFYYYFNESRSSIYNKNFRIQKSIEIWVFHFKEMFLLLSTKTKKNTREV